MLFYQDEETLSMIVGRFCPTITKNELTTIP
jgi:hypothetical protein